MSGSISISANSTIGNLQITDTGKKILQAQYTSMAASGAATNLPKLISLYISAPVIGGALLGGSSFYNVFAVLNSTYNNSIMINILIIYY